MNKEQLRKSWLEEEARPLRGWDFSHLQTRCNSAPLSWDYAKIVQSHLKPSDQLLDMATGGGEFLLSLHHPYQNTSATEAYPPNISLCKKTLTPLGIRLYPVQNSLLPIPDDSVDIVINRHGNYDPSEVSRVLKPGGLFVTQQVGGENCASLAQRLNFSNNRPLYEGFSMTTELPKLHNCRFEVLYAKEEYPELKFFDVGAVVYFAKIIEWSFPGFSVEKNYTQLCALQDELEQHGLISTFEHRFIIVARVPIN